MVGWSCVPVAVVRTARPAASVAAPSAPKRWKNTSPLAVYAMTKPASCAASAGSVPPVPPTGVASPIGVVLPAAKNVAERPVAEARSSKTTIKAPVPVKPTEGRRCDMVRTVRTWMAPPPSTARFSSKSTKRTSVSAGMAKSTRGMAMWPSLATAGLPAICSPMSALAPPSPRITSTVRSRSSAPGEVRFRPLASRRRSAASGRESKTAATRRPVRAPKRGEDWVPVVVWLLRGAATVWQVGPQSRVPGPSHCSSGLRIPSPHIPMPLTRWRVMDTSRVSPAPSISTLAQPVAIRVLGTMLTGSVPSPWTRMVQLPTGTFASPRALSVAPSAVRVMSTMASGNISGGSTIAGTVVPSALQA